LHTSLEGEFVPLPADRRKSLILFRENLERTERDSLPQLDVIHQGPSHSCHEAALHTAAVFVIVRHYVIDVIMVLANLTESISFLRSACRRLRGIVSSTV
jgi:hypothetical protein